MLLLIAGLALLKATSAVNLLVSLLEARQLTPSSGAHLALEPAVPMMATSRSLSLCLRWNTKLMTPIELDSRLVDVFGDGSFIFYLKSFVPLHVLAFGNNLFGGSFG